MNKFTTGDTVDRILRQSTMSQNDRYLIDAFVIPTLEEKCADIRPNEVEKVRQIEENNIIQYLNVARQVIGLGDPSLMNRLMTTYPFSGFIEESRNYPAGTQRQCVLIKVFIKCLLANGNVNQRVKVQGEMPKKMFSFRQATADSWFNDFVDIHSALLCDVYEKRGLGEAQAHLFASIAYALYQVRPNAYHINGLSDNDALHSILSKFLANEDRYPSVKFSSNNEILFKDC